MNYDPLAPHEELNLDNTVGYTVEQISQLNASANKRLALYSSRFSHEARSNDVRDVLLLVNSEYNSEQFRKR